MKPIRVSIASLGLAVAASAALSGMVRWGLRLPNTLAHGQVQEIVIGSAPMASAIGFGLAMRARARLGGSTDRSAFWPGFLGCGAFAVVAYAAHSAFWCRPYQHYGTDYEVAINAILHRSGMTWDPADPGGNLPRYRIVIASMVALLALPQFAFATLGGWLIARRARVRSRGRDQMGVGRLPGQGDAFAGRGPEDPAIDEGLDLAGEDGEQLILPGVDVGRRFGPLLLLRFERSKAPTASERPACWLTRIPLEQVEFAGAGDRL